MQVVVDGYIFQKQARGGISRLYHEILPIMCDMDNELKSQIFDPIVIQSLKIAPSQTASMLPVSPPSHSQLTQRRALTSRLQST